MKNVICSKILTLFLCIAILSSCEKEETFVDETSITNEEGFMSETGQSNTFIDESNSSKAKKPLLHMSFGSDVSKEEAQTQFDKAVAKYKSTKLNQNKELSTEWIYQMRTYTGDEANNKTDGEVRATVYFDTDKQKNVKDEVILDNIGNDREGGWDFYLFRTSIPGQAVEWVEVKSSRIRLKGTDGWFINSLLVLVSPNNQIILNSRGGSFIFSIPYTWLDNDEDDLWDSYNTGAIGKGRLVF